jgi:hypothetical protein
VRAVLALAGVVLALLIPTHAQSFTYGQLVGGHGGSGLRQRSSPRGGKLPLTGTRGATALPSRPKSTCVPGWRHFSAAQKIEHLIA